MASMLSLKAAAITSTGVVSLAVILKLCVPLISDLLVSDIPSFYTIIQSFLRPPYLYLLINGIIISIVASSKFQPKSEASRSQLFPEAIPAPSQPLPEDPNRISTGNIYGSEIVFNSYADAAIEPVAVHTAAAAVPARISDDAYNGAIYRDVNRYSYGNATVAVERSLPHAAPVPAKISYNDATVNQISRGNVYSNVIGSGYDYRDATAVVDRTAETGKEAKPVKSPDPERMDSMDLVNLLSKIEKPPVSRRFAQRKSVKPPHHHHHPEGKTLGVTKLKRHDTLESTWKTITEGRHMPLTRHLKKSDTWERKEQHVRLPLPLPNKMKKSDTFSDCKTATAATKAAAKNNPSPLARSSGSGKLKKDPSLSQDELNRRVEAFIKKVNEEMRLQRQESLNQYQEMIKRGAH